MPCTYSQTGFEGTNFQVNSTTTDNQWFPAVARSISGQSIVVWESFGQDGAGYGIYGQRYDANGSTVGSEFLVNSTTADDQRFPSVGMDADGRFVVAWMSEGQDGDGWGIYAQRYNADGTTSGSQFRANSGASGHQKYPTAAMDTAGNFVIYWQEIDTSTNSYSIEGRPFTFGGALSSDVKVDTTTTGIDAHPHVAITWDGDYIVTWQHSAFDGSQHGILAQKYTSGGTISGTNFQVNVTTANNQINPRISLMPNGFGVFLWSSYDQDGDHYGIYARFIDASGNFKGGEFLVNDSTDNVQDYADLAVSQEGSILFVWDDYNLDGSFSGVYGKSMDTAGMVLDSQFIINTTTDHFQQFGAIAVDSNSRYIVAWQDGDYRINTSVDGSGYTVVSQFMVIDALAPVITCPGNQVDYYDGMCMFAVPDYTDSATVTDNSDPDPVVTQNPPMGTVISANTTIWLIATDDAGNKDSCSFALTLVDSLPPTITCPAMAQRSYDANCMFSVEDYTALATVSDNCDANPTLSQSPMAGSMVGMNTTITIYAQDAVGNIDSCSFTLVLVDDMAPSVSCPSDQADSYDANCQFTLLDYTGLASISDNCDGSPTIVQIPAAGQLVDSDTTIKIRVTDASGNADSCTFMLTLADTTRPSLTCPATQMDDYDANCQFTLLDYRGMATASDNCDPTPTVTQIPAPGQLVDSDTTIKLIIADVSGNMDSCTFMLMLSDTTHPTATCPPNQMDNYDVNCQFTLLDYRGGATVGDNCDPSPTVVQIPAAGQVVDSDTTIVIRVTDASGNVDSCTFMLILSDTTKPVVTCPMDQMDSYDANCQFTVLDYTTLATISDNCDATPTVVQIPAAGQLVDGDTIIKIRVTDASGNADSCMFMLTLADTTRPMLTCPSAQMDSYDANCQFTLLDYRSLATVGDNCDPSPTVEQIPAAGLLVDSDTTIKIRVTDASGNVDSCLFMLTLADTSRPTITCPMAQSDSYDANCQFTLLDYRGLATVMDNCDATTIVEQIPPAGQIVTSDTTIRLRVTDISGNMDSCTFMLTLADTTRPSITCPATQMDDYDANCQFTLLDYRGMATASDNCDPTPTVTQIPAPGQLVDSDTTIKLIIADVSGNMDSCTFMLMLSDTTRPTVTCPTNQMDSYDVNCQFTLLDYRGGATVGDNCDPSPTVVQIPAAGQIVDSDTTIVIRVTDASGNVDSCTFMLTLSDTTRPVVMCPMDQMDSYDANCQFTVLDYTTLATITDNCDATPTVVQIPAAGQLVDGDTIIKIRVTDASGNADSCMFMLTLADTTRPILTCPPAQMDSYDANCQFTLLDYRSLATVGDNCDGSPTVVQIPAAGQLVDSDTMITIRVTDASGNMDSCLFMLTLADTSRPTITCPMTQSDSYDANCQFTLLDYRGLATVVDNCDATAVVEQIPAAGQIVTSDTTIRLRVTDISGNMDSCTFMLTLSDTTLPTITCPMDQMDSYDPNCQFTLLDYRGLAAVADNCDPTPSVTQIPAPGQLVDSDTTIKLIVADVSGNLDSCTFMLTLSDTTRPMITCPIAQMDSYDPNCQFMLLDYRGLATISDNCDANPVVEQIPAAGQIVDSDTMITIRVTDVSGNVDSCTFLLTLADTTGPQVVCPSDQMDSYDADCQFTLLDYTMLATISDNCDPTPTVVQIPAAGQVVDSDTMIVIRATDASGNVDSCMFMLTLADTTRPMITCPGDQMDSFDPNCQFTLPDYRGLAIVTDNCDPSPVLTQIPPAGQTVFGDTTIQLVAIDASGNVDTCDFMLTVGDTTRPVFDLSTVPAVQADFECSGIMPDFTMVVVANDNCDPSPMLTQNPLPGTDLGPIGTMTMVTMSATDMSGNVAMVSFDITVVEPNPTPNLNCGDLNLSVGPDGQVSFLLSEMVSGANCTEAIELQVFAPFGGLVYYADDLIRTSQVSFDACGYTRQALRAVATNLAGASCESALTLSGPSGPLFGSGSSKDVYCFDPLVEGGHIGGAAPEAVIPCGGTVTGSLVADWVTSYPCDIAGQNYITNDTVKVILREYEAFDKDGNRGTVFDTLTVFNLPPLIAGFSGENTYCAELDSTYCGEGGKGPFFVLPERCDPGVPTGTIDFDNDRSFCDTIYFLTYNDSTRSYVVNPLMGKCGLNLHLDKRPFAEGSCETVTKYSLEVKQNCYGREQGLICNGGSFPPDNAFQHHGGAPALGFPNYLICEFWVIDLDTVPPLVQCKYQSELLDGILDGEDVNLDAETFNNIYFRILASDFLDAFFLLEPASDHACAAHAYLPEVCVTDDWSGVKSVKARIEGVGTFALEPRGDCTLRIPDEDAMEPTIDTFPGICYGYPHPIKLPKTDCPIAIVYEVYDSCHLMATDTCYVMVKDQTAPVAVVDKGVTVSLSDKKVWVDAKDLDEGSWDNCGVEQVLARRTDWKEFCVDLCYNVTDAYCGISEGEREDAVDWIWTDGHDTIWCLTLEDDKHCDEIEAHYAKQLDWWRNDSLDCERLLHNAMVYDLIRYATIECKDNRHLEGAAFDKLLAKALGTLVIGVAELPQVVSVPPGDMVEDRGLAEKFAFEETDLLGAIELCDDGFAVSLPLLSGEIDEQQLIQGLLDEVRQIGGGWSESVPFDCSDACGSVPVEVLVMDYWCNWSTSWSQVWVEDKTPVEVVKDVVEEEFITCKVYKENRYAYPDEIHPVSLEYIVDQAKGGAKDANEALDDIFGGYCKAWRDPYGNYVDGEGSEIDGDITFYDSICQCTSYYERVRVFDEHLGYLWIDSLITDCHYYQDTTDFQKGVVIVNCEENVYCEQDVWCEIDHCGQGYIFRKFKIWQGCPDEFYDEHGIADSLRHAVDTIYRHQRIWVGNECELNKYMFDVPHDTEVVTCDISYGPDGNVVGAAGPEGTGYATYKFDDDCRIVGIGHNDKVFKIVGGDAACYKILRTWYFADWCGYGEPLDGQWWRNRELVMDSCVQKIIVRDTTPPTCTIIGPVDDGGAIEVGACYFDLEASVVGLDACGVIKYYWDLKEIKDGTDVAVIDSGYGELSGDTTAGFDISSGNLTHGSYKLVVTLQDDCANEGHCEYYFDVASVKKPAPVCISSLTARLTPWDNDQDGTVDSAHAIVWAAEFNSSSSVACSDTAIEYRVELIDGVDDDTWQEDTSYLEVFCDDFGSHMARLWVISWPSGTVDFCDVVLIVQSDFSGCGTTVSGEPGPVSQVNDMHDVIREPQREGQGVTEITGLSEPGLGGRSFSGSLAPGGYHLKQNRPNPFRQETTVEFILPQATSASLSIFDVTGKLLRTYYGDFAKGQNQVTVRFRDLGTGGILFYRLRADDYTATKKMVLIQ